LGDDFIQRGTFKIEGAAKFVDVINGPRDFAGFFSLGMHDILKGVFMNF
jgi:hypothetical protein